MNLIKLIALHAAGSAYELVTCQSFAQRLIRRKLFTKAPQPSAEECQRLNDQALRSL